ncbi:MAG TPA: hypothetical protein VF244_09565, partial [Acidimicrobiales bacterium]
MGAVLYLLGTWPRRRRAALAGVALLGALSLGFVLLAGLGARRSGSAWEHLRQRARGDEVVVDVANLEDARAVAARARLVPGVENAAALAYAYVVPEGRLEDLFGGVILPLDGVTLEESFRPVLVAGRSADPGRADEVVVNQQFVKAVGFDVGEQFTLVDPVGLIRQPVTIVGVVVHPNDFTTGSGGSVAYPTVAFSQRWDAALNELFDTLGGEVLGPSVFVSGADDLAPGALVARLNTSMTGDDVRGVADLTPSAGPVVDTLGLQRDGYLALAGVAGLTSLTMLLLVLARVTRLQPDETEILRAVGFGTRERVAAVLLPGALVAAMAALGGFVVVLVGQGLVPTGLADRVSAGRRLGDDIGFIALSVLGLAAVLAGLVVLQASRSG